MSFLMEPIRLCTHLLPRQQCWAPTAHPGKSHVRAPGAAGTVGRDYHRCPPGLVEASGGGQSVSARPEHGDLSPELVVGSPCGRTAHWAAAT
jgi:hypothetical protein